MSIETIRVGIRELDSGEQLEPGRVRRRGGGRKPLTESDPTLLADLERTLEADINETAKAALAAGEPVISVDTKKKELVGQFKNGGREWRPKGEPELVRTHDFKDKQLGKAIPYGVYDVANNEGWVSVD